MAVEFYDRHGSANEQVRAHYLLGCAYRDMGEAPLALQYYQEAAEHADTTREDCDYRQLCVNYAQMADLLYEQLLPYDMLTALEKQYHYANRANIILYALIAKEHRFSAYELLGNSDSVLSIKKKAYQEFKQHGYHQEAAQSLGPLIPILIKKGLYEEARQAIQIYETESGFFENGEIRKGKELFFYEKGLYLLATNQSDSAEYYFRKLLRLGQGEDIEGAYKGLYLLYQKKGNRDSVAKYTELCYLLNDQSYREAATEKMRHMQSLYNYSRNQKIAIEKTEEAYQHKIRFILAVLTIILILFIVTFFIVRIKRKQKREVQRLKAEFQQKQATLLQLQYDVYQMKEMGLTSIIQEKEEQIAALEKQLAEDSETLKFEKLGQLDSRLQNSEICRIYGFSSRI